MAKKFPKVTVLISTYNRSYYLKDAIESVVGQAMQDWGLIVMNDGGVDVARIVDEFQDSRIKYFHDPVNRGLPWTDSVKTIVAGLVDNLSYPARFVIVNNDVKEDEPDCRQALGEMGNLKNIRTVTPQKTLREKKTA